MAGINLESKSRIIKVSGDTNANIIEIPEGEEVIRERLFQKRLQMELDNRIGKLMKQKLDEQKPRMAAEKKEAYDSGYREGERVGLEKGYSEVEPLREEFMITIKETIDFKHKIIKESEEAIVSLAFGFARNIVGQEIKTEPDIIINQVKKAIDHIIGEGRLVIRINPADIKIFDRKEDFIPEEYLSEIEVHTDEAIKHGGCIVESNKGIVDATIESQISEMEKHLKGGLETEIGSDT
ncbi:MAG: hypothetical protein GY863_24540 [bacterium]|nr:hypothetical protein [bacterium]